MHPGSPPERVRVTQALPAALTRARPGRRAQASRATAAPNARNGPNGSVAPRAVCSGEVRFARRGDDFWSAGSSHMPPHRGDEHGLDAHAGQEVSVVSLESELKPFRSEVEPDQVAGSGSSGGRVRRPKRSRPSTPSPKKRRVVRIRLLVVEDKDVFRRQLRSVLEPEAFQVAEARSGEAALECVSRFRADVVNAKVPGDVGHRGDANAAGIDSADRRDHPEHSSTATSCSRWRWPRVSAYPVKGARLDEIRSAIQPAARGRSRSWQRLRDPRRVVRALVDGVTHERRRRLKLVPAENTGRTRCRRRHE